MRKQIVLLLFFVLVLAIVSCNNQEHSDSVKPYLLKIKMKETECFRCGQGAIIIRSLSEVADVEIVFNGLNDNTIYRFLQTNGLEYVKKTDGYKIVSDKEEYSRLNTISNVSEGHLFDKNGNEIMVFQLRLDEPTMNRLNDIQRKGRALMQKAPITLKTDYDNDGIDLSVQDDFFVLTNRPMNLCQIFNLNGEIVREINGNLVDPAVVFPELEELDSMQLKSIKDDGSYRSSLEGVFINENEIWIGFTVACPTIKDGTCYLYSYYQLLSYPLYESTQQFKVIFDGRPHNVIAMAFDYKNEDKLYTIIQQYDEESLFTCNIAKCEKQDGHLVLKDEHPIHYPIFEQKELLWYQPVLKDGLLNLKYTEYIVDIQTDTVFSLPFQYNTKVVDNGGFDVKVTMDAQLIDWVFDGKTLGLIYYDIVEGKKAQCHYLSWRRGQTDFVNASITLPHEEVVSLKLAFPNVVYYLTKDNKVGTICINEQNWG